VENKQARAEIMKLRFPIAVEFCNETCIVLELKYRAAAGGETQFTVSSPRASGSPASI
jgi:hypothetical protein